MSSTEKSPPHTSDTAKPAPDTAVADSADPTRGGSATASPAPAAPRTWQDLLFSPRLRHSARAIEFVAVLVGMSVVFFEFGIQRPKDRDLRDVQLHATIATLATNKEVEDTSPAVQKLLAFMHQESVPMTGISIPNVFLKMPAFDNVDWSDAYMRGVQFVCTERLYRLIDDHDPSMPKFDPCVRLRHAYFNGTTLRNARFEYADLSHAKFNAADLTEVEIDNAAFVDAEFIGADVSAIKIHRGDFSNTRFSRPSDHTPKFDCRRHERENGSIQIECTSLKWVLFSSSELHKAVFRGATIDEVDFLHAKMKRSKFECDSFGRNHNRIERCTTIERACFRGADLSRATFENVNISQTDFSGAALRRATFENVHISQTDFAGTDLGRARFENGSILKSDFTDANLDETKFKNIIFVAVVFPQNRSKKRTLIRKV